MINPHLHFAHDNCLFIQEDVFLQLSSLILFLYGSEFVRDKSWLTLKIGILSLSGFNSYINLYISLYNQNFTQYFYCKSSEQNNSKGMITQPASQNQDHIQQNKKDSIHHQQSQEQQSPTKRRPNHLKLARQNSYAPFSQQHQQLFGDEPVSAFLKSQKYRQFTMIFTVPEISTRAFKQTFKQIMQSFNSIDNFTQNMEKKVDLLLKQQQNQFVQSYTEHMRKIKKQFTNIQKRIQGYQQKIKYYQNQGKMSHLVIKVSKLEEQCKNLYFVIDNKQKQIKQRDLTIKVIKSQLKRLQKQRKVLIRQKNQLSLTRQFSLQKSSLRHLGQSKLKSEEDQYILDNQNIIQKDLQNDSKTMLSKNQTTFNLLDQISQNRNSSHKRKLPMFNNTTIKNDISQKSITCDVSLGSANHYKKSDGVSVQKNDIIAEQKIKSKYHKQLLLLKKKNQLLNSFQSRVLDEKSSLQNFIIQCVNQIKLQILHRNKKILNKKSYCYFEDFKNEDKIQLMIKIISSQQILQHLYDKVFNKKKIIANSTTKRQDKNNQIKLKSVSTVHNNSISMFRQTERQNLDKCNRQSSSIKKADRQKFKSFHNGLPKIQFNLQY